MTEQPYIENITSKGVYSRTYGTDIRTNVDLVLLHGWGLNGGSFEHFAKHLSHDYRVTCIDLPGFGHSAQCLPIPYTAETLAELVSDAMPENAVLVGWSMGGLVAQQVALQHVHPLKGLITIASTPFFMQAHGWSGIRDEVLTSFSTQLERGFEKTIERFLAIQALGSDTAKQDIRSLKSIINTRPAPSEQALHCGLALLKDSDLRADIARISCPTLRVYGKRDSLVPVSAVDQIHALHPQSDNVVVAQASHAPFISHADVTATVLSQFVSRLA